jgi:hypothetical protein
MSFIGSTANFRNRLSSSADDLHFGLSLIQSFRPFGTRQAEHSLQADPGELSQMAHSAFRHFDAVVSQQQGNLVKWDP